MIHEINGDLLDATSGIICHQTNYHGVMGAGVARAIADKILTTEQYNAYVNYCWQAGRMALGNVQFLGNAPGLVVANIFSQDEAKARINGKYDITDYNAMFMALQRVRDLAEAHNMTVRIPYKMGCGIAGGDWDRVRQIIYSIFGASTVDVFIVKKEQTCGRF